MKVAFFTGTAVNKAEIPRIISILRIFPSARSLTMSRNSPLISMSAASMKMTVTGTAGYTGITLRGDATITGPGKKARNLFPGILSLRRL